MHEIHSSTKLFLDADHTAERTPKPRELSECPLGIQIATEQHTTPSKYTLNVVFV